MYRSLSSNLSLRKPPLCTSVFYSSAMTLRRESFFWGDLSPLVPFQVLLASYDMTASGMNYSYWGGPNLRLQFFFSLRAQKQTLPNNHLLDAGAGTGGNVEHSAITIL